LPRPYLGVAHAADAQDATQEILIKILTPLGSFRGDSDFMTWAQRIAISHLTSLLRTRTSKEVSFDTLATDLEDGLRFGAKQSAPAEDEQLLAYQVFIECADPYQRHEHDQYGDCFECPAVAAN
jgi:DNA-directed RNA polymerase specialized sigma24 family protein